MKHCENNFMNKFSIILFLGIMTLGLTSCNNEPEPGDLDQIKAFQPEENYFKSSLVSLHFVIETSPIDKIDTLFSQLIDNYNLPVSASGIPDGI